MRILDFLSEDAIEVNLSAKGKREVIEEIVEILVKTGKIVDSKKAVDVLMEREKLGSTGIGQGVAIPHGKSDCVKDITAAFGLSQDGVGFDALDGEPVFLFFLLLSPDGASGMHLKALAKISTILKDKHFRKMLMKAKAKEEVVKILKEEENLKR